MKDIATDIVDEKTQFADPHERVFEIFFIILVRVFGAFQPAQYLLNRRKQLKNLSPLSRVIEGSSLILVQLPCMERVPISVKNALRTRSGVAADFRKFSNAICSVFPFRSRGT